MELHRSQKKEFSIRVARVQALVNALDPLKLLKSSDRSYEQVAKEVALATYRFSKEEDLGLAIHKIFSKSFGEKSKRFDYFSLARKILQTLPAPPSSN